MFPAPIPDDEDDPRLDLIVNIWDRYEAWTNDRADEPPVFITRTIASLVALGNFVGFIGDKTLLPLPEDVPAKQDRQQAQAKFFVENLGKFVQNISSNSHGWLNSQFSGAGTSDLNSRIDLPGKLTNVIGGYFARKDIDTPNLSIGSIPQAENSKHLKWTK